MQPYYEHAGITIYHGDCREILPTLSKCDLLLTDPPYGVTQNAWDNAEAAHVAATSCAGWGAHRMVRRCTATRLWTARAIQMQHRRNEMGHLKDIGKCDYCRERIITPMDMKEHTVGDVRRNDIVKWKQGKDLRAA